MLLNAEDFAVEVQNLPPITEYHSLMELKALLWNHMERVAENQEQCIKNLDSYDSGSVVYDINFGMQDYSKMKIMIKIYNDTKQLGMEELRMNRAVKTSK